MKFIKLFKQIKEHVEEFAIAYLFMFVTISIWIVLR